MVATPSDGPGFWMVRYSTKPWRTVPSAKEKLVAGSSSPLTAVPPSTTVPTPGSLEKYKTRSPTTAAVATTAMLRLTGVLTPWPATKPPTLTVTRLEGGRATTSAGSEKGTPPSSAAWNWSVATASDPPGFWSVRYSTKPGRTVPSAKYDVWSGPPGPSPGPVSLSVTVTGMSTASRCVSPSRTKARSEGSSKPAAEDAMTPWMMVTASVGSSTESSTAYTRTVCGVSQSAGVKWRARSPAGGSGVEASASSRRTCGAVAVKVMSNGDSGCRLRTTDIVSTTAGVASATSRPDVVAMSTKGGSSVIEGGS